jgi:hypothetical protein
MEYTKMQGIDTETIRHRVREEPGVFEITLT